MALDRGGAARSRRLEGVRSGRRIALCFTLLSSGVCSNDIENPVDGVWQHDYSGHYNAAFPVLTQVGEQVSGTACVWGWGYSAYHDVRLRGRYSTFAGVITAANAGERHASWVGRSLVFRATSGDTIVEVATGEEYRRVTTGAWCS